jgi:predicted RNase H-like HicB family nuclease
MRYPKGGLRPSLDHYTTVTHPDDNGTFVAEVLAIPGCHAWGATREEAQQELVNVFDMIQEERLYG